MSDTDYAPRTSLVRPSLLTVALHDVHGSLSVRQNQLTCSSIARHTRKTGSEVAPSKKVT